MVSTDESDGTVIRHLGLLVGQETVEWAVVDTDGEATAQQIRAFDTEMNTIFVGAAGSTQFVSYDSNDRFNIDFPAVDGGDRSAEQAC